MKKEIIIICTSILLGNTIQSQASDADEYQGKLWKKECEKQTGMMKKFQCCRDKYKECKEEGIDKDKCKKRYKFCKRKTTSTDGTAKGK